MLVLDKRKEILNETSNVCKIDTCKNNRRFGTIGDDFSKKSK